MCPRPDFLFVEQDVLLGRSLSVLSARVQLDRLPLRIVERHADDKKKTRPSSFEERRAEMLYEDNLLVEHDLIGKPVPTFPDHAQ